MSECTHSGHVVSDVIRVIRQMATQTTEQQAPPSFACNTCKRKRKCVCPSSLLPPLTGTDNPILAPDLSQQRDFSFEQLKSFLRQEMNLFNSSISSEVKTTISEEFKRLEVSMDKVTKQVQVNTSRLNVCEEKINNLSLKLDKSVKEHNQDSLSCLGEIEDRFVRKFNLLFHGLKELESNTIGNSHDYDKSAIISVVNHLCPNLITLNNIRVKRIGLFSQNSVQTRPLIVTFEDLSKPKTILNAFLKSKRDNQLHQDLQGVLIYHDRTKMQQADFKRAKIELSDRISKGEENLVIRFRRGIPEVVKKHPVQAVSSAIVQ